MDEGVLIDFAKVGRNKATTFAGLCESHDRELFAPIETQPLALDDSSQLFLLAYRAVLFELHATCAAGALLHAAYAKRVELGIDPKGKLSPAGQYATERMAIAFETNLYKLRFDQALTSGDTAFLLHDVSLLEVSRPTVAASALISLDGVANDEGDVVRICLTVLPVDQTRIAAVLSYLPEDAPLARVHLDRIITTRGAHQMYELSRRIINHCSNFVIAPHYFDSWAQRKRDTIREYFVRTIRVGDLAVEDPDLMLFESAA
jgi:hypothetical protein